MFYRSKPRFKLFQLFADKNVRNLITLKFHVTSSECMEIYFVHLLVDQIYGE